MLEINIFLIYGLQIWKCGIKNKKDPENIKNINKEDFLHQTQVHSSNYKKAVKSKFTLAAIKRESSQRKKTHGVSEHSNTHPKMMQGWMMLGIKSKKK